jgi:hypothetical protein
MNLTKVDDTVENGEMIVTIDDISQKFDDLISERTSREEIANFASQAMRANDQDLLILKPKSEKTKIWDAILYLSGVDLKDSPDSYLHIIDDFINYQNSAKIR